MSKEVVLNKSQTYLLPLLSELVPFRMDMLDFIDNTYISDDLSKYENCLFVLQDFTFKSPEFTAYENTLIQSDCYVDLIDVGNKVLYVFRIPEEYLHEYNCFKSGRYSAFGTDAKEMILAFWTRFYNKQVEGIPFVLKVKQILFKDEKLRKQLEKELSSEGAPGVPGHQVTIDEDAELSDPPCLESETFELSKVKQNENKL
jgi:hypothetical protein